MNKNIHLFSDQNYSYKGLPNRSESFFYYLNRSGREMAFKIRNLLEEWFSRYPEKEKSEFIKRFRTDDDDQFIAAFFELYLHELFHKLGYKITIHPKITSSSKKPDFFIIDSKGRKAYVEACVVEEKKDETKSERKILNKLLDTVDTIECEDFFLSVSTQGYPTIQPPDGKIKAEIKKWLENLDPLKFKKQKLNGNLENMPKKVFSFPNWSIEFIAYPQKRRSKKDSFDRLIKIDQGNIQNIRTPTHLKESIKKKANKYKNFNIPFIIAVNIQGRFFDDISTMEALFGQEVVHILFQDIKDGIKTKLGRNPNGALISKKRLIYTRISGLIIGKLIQPWTIVQRDLYFWHNPGAKYPFHGPLLQLPQFIPKDNKMIKQEGIHPRNIFNLSINWPGDS